MIFWSLPIWGLEVGRNGRQVVKLGPRVIFIKNGPSWSWKHSISFWMTNIGQTYSNYVSAKRLIHGSAVNKTNSRFHRLNCSPMRRGYVTEGSVGCIICTCSCDTKTILSHAPFGREIGLKYALLAKRSLQKGLDNTLIINTIFLNDAALTKYLRSRRTRCVFCFIHSAIDLWLLVNLRRLYNNRLTRLFTLHLESYRLDLRLSQLNLIQETNRLHNNDQHINTKSPQIVGLRPSMCSQIF